MNGSNTDIAMQIKHMTQDSHENPILIVFTAPWISQSGIVEIISDKIVKANSRIKIVTINADDNLKLVHQYKIDQLPTAILIQNAQITNKIVGTWSKKEILEKIII